MYKEDEKQPKYNKKWMNLYFAHAEFQMIHHSIPQSFQGSIKLFVSEPETEWKRSRHDMVPWYERKYEETDWLGKERLTTLIVECT